MDRDLALFNGSIWSDGRILGPRWGVICRGGQIWQVGTDVRLKQLLTRDFDAYDLEGRLVLPGFIDSHLHLASLGFALGEVNLDEAASEEEAVALVEPRARKAAEGEWVRGRGWHSNEWPGGGYPTKASLDAVSPLGVPVWLRSRCGHAAWANSAAMEAAGVTKETESPPGGEIVRDPGGEPTGVFLEKAMFLVTGKLPARSLGERVAAAQRAIGHLHALGVTGAVICGEADGLAALQALDSGGALPLRLLTMPTADQIDSVLGMGVSPGFGSESLSLGPVKIFADGSLGSRTAVMFGQYPGGGRGIFTTEPEELEELVGKANGAGWPVAIHAIGDRAVAASLDAIESVGDPSLRNRIEHAQSVRADDIVRFRELGAVASVQPVHLLCDRGAATELWGEAAETAFPLMTMSTRGVKLAFGSDAPVASADPFLGLHAAVNRAAPGSDEGPWVPGERMPLSEALFAYAEGGAYAAGWEHRRGRVVPGYDADFAVVSANPFEMPAEELAGLHVVATVVAGRVVHMTDQ